MRAAKNPPSGHAPDCQPTPAWQLIALTAAAYFIAGYVALMLAIPPGYAAPIWPAAAIALIAVLKYGNRVWISIWLGSIAVNTINGWPPGAGIDYLPVALKLPFFIGLGAAGGALFGASAIRRRIGFPTPLNDLKSVATFMLLGGPLACLISASVGIGVLVISGVIPVANAPFNWATWWIGDSLGVLLFSIVLLPFVSNEFPLWRRRRVLVPTVLLTTSVLMIVLYLRFSHAEVNTQQQQFGDRAREVQATLEVKLQMQLEVLHGVAGLMQSQRAVERQDFQRYVMPMIARHQGIQAISWNPLVDAAKRSAYEEQARAEGLPEFRFTERNATNDLVTATTRESYIPVLFIAPVQGNQSVLGFDLLSNPDRAATIQRSINTRTAAATQPIRLVQETGDQRGVIVFIPVFDGTQDSRVFKGVISGAFRIGDWVDKTLDTQTRAGLLIRIENAQQGGELIYPPSATQTSAPGLYSVQLPIHIADQTWWLKIDANQDFLAQTRSYVPWSILAAGMLFASLLGAFLLTTTGGSYRMEETNLQLRTMLQELSDTQSELVESKRLVSLGAMVSGLAHELNTPLGIAITANSGLPQSIQDIQTALTDGSLTETELVDALKQWEGFTTMTQRNLDRAAELVRTFKSAVADRSVHSILEFDLVGKIDEILNHLKLLEPTDRISINLISDEPTVLIESIPNSLEQIITNVVNNGKIHAYEADEKGAITITLKSQRETIDICIQDHGKGMSAEVQSKIFEPFFTTRRGRGGTGLGLHIVHNLVKQQLGGTLHVSSTLGAGTTFTITLPRHLTHTSA